MGTASLRINLTLGAALALLALSEARFVIEKVRGKETGHQDLRVGANKVVVTSLLAYQEWKTLYAESVLWFNVVL